MNIYLAPPNPSNPKQSPFCSTRAALLEALSNGGRHGYDEPYIGKSKSPPTIPNDSNILTIWVACTSRWFGAAEICLILERFNSLAFIGDDIARSIYLAFNMLLREDLAYGGLKGSDVLNDQDRKTCKCDNQFLDECEVFGITSSDSLKKAEDPGQGGSSYYCDRKS